MDTICWRIPESDSSLLWRVDDSLYSVYKVHGKNGKSEENCVCCFIKRSRQRCGLFI